MKFIINRMVDCYKFGIDASKLTIIKFKLIVFTAFLGIFGYNYFFKFVKRGSEISIEYEPQDVPVSLVYLTGILIAYLVLVDIFDHDKRTSKWVDLIKDPTVPLDIRNKLTDELIKRK